MTVGFEAKRFFKNFTGLGNYSRFVVDSLSQHVSQNHYILYTPKVSDHPEVTQITQRSNVEVISPPALYNKLHLGSLWRSWGMTLDDSMKRLDVFHGLSHEFPVGLSASVKKVVTVHDLIFMRYPQFYNAVDALIYKTKVKAACRTADKIIAISQQTADDLVEFLQADASKISVVYQGSHTIFKNDSSSEEIKSVKKKYNLPDQYMLNVGTIEERKNIIVLVKALALLKPEERLPLVIIGRRMPYFDKVMACARELAVLPYITFLHNASFSDFPHIYQGAQLFVYPSFFEGFGIPLIEAIESKIPVITSAGSCFREAAGPDALYFNPTDEKALASLIKNVCTDASLRSRMISNAFRYIQKFQPEVIAGQINSIYASL